MSSSVVSLTLKTFPGFKPAPGEHNGCSIANRWAPLFMCLGMQCGFNNLSVYRPPDATGTEIYGSSAKSAAVSLGIQPTVCFRLPTKSSEHTIIDI